MGVTISRFIARKYKKFSIYISAVRPVHVSHTSRAPGVRLEALA